MPTTAHVVGCERMMIGARITHNGIFVQFADEAEGVLPFDDLNLPNKPVGVDLPDPYSLIIQMKNDQKEEIPWDFARHYVDSGYRERSEKASGKGRLALGKRLKLLRSREGFSQEELAKRSAIGRATIARIEGGDYSPRYATLLDIARGLKCNISELLLDLSTATPCLNLAPKANFLPPFCPGVEYPLVNINRLLQMPDATPLVCTVSHRWLTRP